MPLTYNAQITMDSWGKRTDNTAGPGTTEPQPNVCYTVNRAGRNRIVFSPHTIQQVQMKNHRDCRAKQPSNNNNPKGANRVKPKSSNFPGSRRGTVVCRQDHHSTSSIVDALLWIHFIYWSCFLCMVRFLMPKLIFLKLDQEHLKHWLKFQAIHSKQLHPFCMQFLISLRHFPTFANNSSTVPLSLLFDFDFLE